MRPTIPTVILTTTFALLLAPSGRAAEPGNLWQVETTMEMPGMKMPGRTSQVCTPVAAEGPEAMAGGNDDCTMSNVKRSAGRFSYDVTCPQGSGSGEMTYQGRDSYSSKMTMTSDGRTITMTPHGMRLRAAVSFASPPRMTRLEAARAEKPTGNPNARVAATHAASTTAVRILAEVKGDPASALAVSTTRPFTCRPSASHASVPTRRCATKLATKTLPS